MIYFVPFIVLQCCVLLLWWILWLLRSRMNPFARGCLSLFFIAIFVCWVLRAYRHYWPQAVIASQEALLYVGPEKDYPARGVLKHLEKIVIEQKKDGWYYVSSSQGRGWVQAKDLVSAQGSDS